MGDLLHANTAFRNPTPQPGHMYRQFTVIEGSNNFELWFYEGDEKPEPDSTLTSTEIHFHPTLKAALDEFERECRRAEEEGWIASPAW